MEMVKKEIRGVEYTFVNNTWSTSDRWGHETTLFRNGAEIGNNRVRYYNITWESYRYRSCMMGCISRLIEARQKELEESFKEKNNIQRFSYRTKTLYLEFRDEDSEYQELKELYEAL